MEHQVLTSVRTAAPAEFGLASLAIPTRLLLTSDGVHKTLTHEAMTEIMRTAKDPAGALVAAAREAGTRDNTTAAVVDNVFLPPTTPVPVVAAAA
jgi:serine/threonine protein phosphatase PrpC